MRWHAQGLGDWLRQNSQPSSNDITVTAVLRFRVPISVLGFLLEGCMFRVLQIPLTLQFWHVSFIEDVTLSLGVNVTDCLIGWQPVQGISSCLSPKVKGIHKQMSIRGFKKWMEKPRFFPHSWICWTLLMHSLSVKFFANAILCFVSYWYCIYTRHPLVSYNTVIIIKTHDSLLIVHSILQTALFWWATAEQIQIQNQWDYSNLERERESSEHINIRLVDIAINGNRHKKYFKTIRHSRSVISSC